MVINKHAGIVVHAGINNEKNTLSDALFAYTDQLSDIGGMERRGIVHRLDKDTSGLMVIAKSNDAHLNLVKQLKERTLERKYKALTWGVIKPLSGIIDYPMMKNKSDRTKMMAVMKNSKRLEDAKEAITEYKTIEVFANGAVSLIECTLKTGRTHQIRVHLSAKGNSIVGDQTYGQNFRKINNIKDEVKECLSVARNQMLYSYYIKLEHPITGVNLEFDKELPDIYNSLVARLRTL